MTETVQAAVIRADVAKASTTDALLAEQIALEYVQRVAKGSLEAIRAELIARTSKDLDAALDVAKKQGGTIHFLFGNMELTANIDKTVEWDTAKLMPVAGGMPWEAAQKLFKFEIGIPEAIYKTLPAVLSLTAEGADMLKKIEAARSVKYGKPKITAHTA